MLEVRALRRQHYFKKLKNQQEQLYNLKNKSGLDFNSKQIEMNQRITSELINFKKARLIEDRISYEDLAIMDNFSEDEITYEMNRKIMKGKKDRVAL